MYRCWLVVLVLILGPGSAARAEPVRAHAMRRTSAIAIDGALDEPSWATAPSQTGFVQRFPRDGAAPARATRFAVQYDDEAVYVGVWAEDPEPGAIRRLLTRRDVDAPADAITVSFDSYHDRRTAYAFQLNAAGVQRDMLVFDDSQQDDTWDAVWTGDVAITATGWTAEFRIPLSQLRFASADAQEWGMQVLRVTGRTGEQDSWSPWPRSAPQIVSKFGVVDGIDHLRDSRRLELLPYATAGVQRMPVDAGDPLNDRWGLKRNLGLDLKYGLGPAFTISATINPDFGQVEADPSRVNLTASELFFAEKRPFFLEGADLFKLQLGNSDNSTEGAFYSRRIGAAPAIPDVDYDYIKAKDSTTIYGAAKLTGKTASGWSVGVLDAVTGGATTNLYTAATPDAPAQRADLDVAALTNFAIARIKHDFDEGRTSVGVSATAVNRQLDDADLKDVLHDQAYTGGLQLQNRWGDRWGSNAWTSNVNVISSWIHGSKEAIAATQEDSVHYFQRPDATDHHFDPERTSMSGVAVKYLVGRLGDTEHWKVGVGGDLRTGGVELNDAGFQLNSDRYVPFFLVQYAENSPSKHVLNWGTSDDIYLVQTLEPRLDAYGIEYNGNVQLSSYWSISAGGNAERSIWSMAQMRGGPGLRLNPITNYYATLTSDTRQPLWFSVNAYGSHVFVSGSQDGGVDLGATIQAKSNLDLFVGPSIYLRNDPMQYVDQEPDSVGDLHYIFARIHEFDVSMTLRANWTFSPHLTLQAYAQPYIASGHYDELKDVDHPSAERYRDRFHMLAAGEARLVDGTYSVNRGGRTYAFDQPDFNFRQLRSTVVLRWEYLPGSTVFAIWSHGQTSDAFDNGRLQLGRDLSDLGRAASENVVMIKANYWIGL
ncbi:MAG TPA: DUF5916 domain-containing protein [Kofleriaceae bacterium]